MTDARARPERVFDYSGLARYVPVADAPPAFLLDLDGTLCRMNGRGPYEEDKVGTDLVCKPVRDAAYALVDAGYTAIILSGRGRKPNSRQITIDWLRQHWHRPYVGPFMRPSGDSRRDYLVKHELFMTHVAPYWRVLCAFDDRNQVVQMYRHIGVTVFQVADGNF